MALQGSLKDMSVADIIQHQCQDRKTALLTVERKEVRARIFFKDGNVIHAESGALSGEDVIYDILAWEEGYFNIEIGYPTQEVSIHRNWSSLLLEGAKRLDESKIEPSQNVDEPVQPKEIRKDLITTTLMEFMSVMTGFYAVAVTGIDGNIIASCLNGLIDESLVGGITTAALNFGKRGLNLVNSGPYRMSFLQGDKGMVFVAAVDPYTLFLGISAPTINVPDALRTVRAMVNRISQFH